MLKVSKKNNGSNVIVQQIQKHPLSPTAPSSPAKAAQAVGAQAWTP